MKHYLTQSTRQGLIDSMTTSTLSRAQPNNNNQKVTSVMDGFHSSYKVFYHTVDILLQQ